MNGQRHRGGAPFVPGGLRSALPGRYLSAALQLRALRKELVDSRQMSNTAFHDEILRQGQHADRTDPAGARQAAPDA
jgi:hypothetical protein